MDTWRWSRPDVIVTKMTLDRCTPVRGVSIASKGSSNRRLRDAQDRFAFGRDRVDRDRALARSGFGRPARNRGPQPAPHRPRRPHSPPRPHAAGEPGDQATVRAAEQPEAASPSVPSASRRSPQSPRRQKGSRRLMRSLGSAAPTQALPRLRSLPRTRSRAAGSNGGWTGDLPVSPLDHRSDLLVLPLRRRHHLPRKPDGGAGRRRVLGQQRA